MTGLSERVLLQGTNCKNKNARKRNAEVKMSEQHLYGQPITCSSKTQMDREGLDKTNYADLLDKWEQSPGTRPDAGSNVGWETHIFTYICTYCSPWQVERATKECGMSLTFP